MRHQYDDKTPDAFRVGTISKIYVTICLFHAAYM